jgi:hypothetical protein
MNDFVLIGNPFVWLIVIVTIYALVMTVRHILERISEKENPERFVGESLHILLYLSGASILLGLFGYVATLYSSMCSGAAMPGSGFFSIIVIPADHPGFLPSLADCYSKSTGVGLVGMFAAMLIGLCWYFLNTIKKV